jgi:hypothetical protein
VGLRTGLYRVTAETDPHQVVALNILMSPCSTVARKEIVQQMGGFYEHGARFGEDSYLWLKLLLNHPVQLLEQEGAVFHREASELSGNYRGMRPLEPFLLDPDGVRKDCPEAVRPVLDRVLAIRAMKTSCVLSYWGHWRQARMLRRQYRVPEAWRLNWYVPSLLAATPLGSLAGAGVRALRGPR